MKILCAYQNYKTVNHGRQKYSVHIDDNPSPDMEFYPPRFQVSGIHPYDDAEYTWAKFDGDKIKFYRDGKFKDSMSVHEYDPDDYESYDEYVNDIVFSTAVELTDMNKDVEPRMIHN